MRKSRFSATIVYGAGVLVLLAAVVRVVVSCGRRQSTRMSPVPMDTLLPDTIRVKSVVRKDVVHSPVVVSPETPSRPLSAVFAILLPSCAFVVPYLAVMSAAGPVPANGSPRGRAGRTRTMRRGA